MLWSRKHKRPKRKPRITHKRMAPKPGAPANAEERAYLTWIGQRPCLMSGKPATVHHVSASIHGGRITRSHYRTVPLAPEFHLIQHGPETSVEALGHKGFFQFYGIDLLAEAERLRQLYLALEEA